MTAPSYWDRGLSYGDYLAQMTTRRDEYDSNFDSTTLDSATLNAFSGTKLRFLAITEDWCGDSSQFLPALAKLVSNFDTLDMRFLLRPEVQELADQYRDDSGRQPIPVIVVIDDDGTERGALLERPTAVTERMAAETGRFAAENSHLDGIRRTYSNMPEATKEAVSSNIATWRAARQQEFASILFADLAAIAGIPVKA